jgi:hypothetical protein
MKFLNKLTGIIEEPQNEMVIEMYINDEKQFEKITETKNSNKNSNSNKNKNTAENTENTENEGNENPNK